MTCCPTLPALAGCGSPAFVPDHFEVSPGFETAEFRVRPITVADAAKERKFARRHSFTYTVVSPDESRVLGCVYINEGIGGPDAAVFLRVRRSEHDAGLDSRLEAAVRDWMETDRPFDRVVYPGRKRARPEAGQTN